jgi:hypothetical protein
MEKGSLGSGNTLSYPGGPSGPGGGEFIRYNSINGGFIDYYLLRIFYKGKATHNGVILIISSKKLRRIVVEKSLCFHCK